MGDEYNKGYSTSEEEEDLDDAQFQEMYQKLQDSDDNDANQSDVLELDEESKALMQLEDAIKKRPYIISYRSNYRFFWDVIIIIFAI